MQSSYIYSVSRTNTLAQSLLGKTDIERLLVADPGEELQFALKETYLASYLLHVGEENFPLAIEETLIEAKRLVHRLAPNGDMFRFLWALYDIQNLRVFAKARAAGLSYESIVPFTSRRGIYEPSYLYERAEAGTLNALQLGWQDAFNEATRHAAEREIAKIGMVFDELYFTTSTRITEQAHDRFISRYQTALIDIFNLRRRLRMLAHPGFVSATGFVAGGSFSERLVETLDQVYSQFANLGGAAHWEDALEHHRVTGNTTRLDARADEYLLTIAKQASVDVFSPASLVSYYLLTRQAAANIRTIIVGKESGMSPADIRANLRLAYVNE